MRTISGVDYKAMRFERDVLEVSLAFLKKETEKMESLKVAMIEKISTFPLTINIVAKQKEIILAAYIVFQCY